MCAVGGAALPSSQHHWATVEGQIRRGDCEKVSLRQGPSLCVSSPEGDLPRKVDLTRLLWEGEEGDSHLRRVSSGLSAVQSVTSASPLDSRAASERAAAPAA